MMAFEDVARQAGVPPSHAARQLSRELVLSSRWHLARLLGYDVEQPAIPEKGKHYWDLFHNYYVDRRLPELQDLPGIRHLSLWPRGTFKTALGQILDVTYRILRNPQRRFLVGSWKHDMAVKMTRKIKEHLEHPKLVELFPEILWERPAKDAPVWTQDEFTVRRSGVSADATVTAFSLESLPVGLHGDEIRCDDLVEERNTQTEDALLKVREKSLDLKNLKASSDSQIWVTGTLWDPEDLYHAWMQAGSGWIVDRAPALEEDPTLEECFRDEAGRKVFDISRFTPRFPNAKPKSQIEQDYEDEINAGFDAQHFSGQIFLRMDQTSNSLWGTMPKRYFSLDDIPVQYNGAITVDLATDEGDCDSAATCALHTSDDRILIVDGVAGKLDPYELTDHLFRMQGEWGVTVYIEEIGLAKFFEESLILGSQRHGKALIHEKIPSGWRTQSKTTRIRALDGWYRNGNVLCLDPDTLPAGTQRMYFVTYLHQACRFPDLKLNDALETVADQVHLVRAPRQQEREVLKMSRRQKAVRNARTKAIKRTR